MEKDTVLIGDKEYKLINGNYVPYEKPIVGSYKGISTNVSEKEKSSINSGGISDDNLKSLEESDRIQQERSNEINENFHSVKNPKYDNAIPGTERKYFIQPNELRVDSDNIGNSRNVASYPYNLYDLNLHEDLKQQEDIATNNQVDKQPVFQRQNAGLFQSQEDPMAFIRNYGEPQNKTINPNYIEQQIPKENKPAEIKNKVTGDFSNVKTNDPLIKKVIENTQKEVFSAASSAPITSQSSSFKNLVDQLEKDSMDLANAKMSGQKDLAEEARQNAISNLEKIQAMANGERDATDKYISDLSQIDDHISRTRLVDDMPIMNKLVAGIALFVGSRTADGKNQALSVLNSEIEKDIQNQKTEYERKSGKVKNAYESVSKYYQNESMRYSLTKAATADMMLAKISEIEAGNIPLQTKIALDQFKINLEATRNSSTAAGLKEAVDLQNSILEGKSKILGIRKTEKDMKTKEDSFLVPDLNGGQPQRALTQKGAEEIRKLGPIFKEASESLQAMYDSLDKVNANSPLKFWRDSIEELGIKAKITTLKNAIAAMPDQRMALAEVKNLGKMFDEMAESSNIMLHKDVYAKQLIKMKEELIKRAESEYKVNGMLLPKGMLGGKGEAGK